jgi:muramoyltetrapeptide carboxypeptidase LdcA involved in peptidoglycan recycling
MRYPEFLKENGKIGFAAPSFGCNIEPYRSGFENAQKKFKALGHQIVLGPNCYEGKGIGISNIPEACGKELTDMYCGDAADIIISCGGGELMCETMEHVDFDRIRQAAPKWFMGYSDNTNMTFLLATLADTASIYGQCAASFGMKKWHKSIQDAYDILRGNKLTVEGYDRWERESLKDEEHPLAPYNLTEKKILRVFRPEDGQFKESAKDEEINISGRLIGGCLDCLVTLLGTRFDKTAEFAEKYKEDGLIWFIESCDLNVFGIRRAIWQMKNAGWFKYVRGFIVGRPYVFGQEMMGLDHYHAVIDLLEGYEVPVIMDADIGHLPPMMPLICGSAAEVYVKGNEISVKMQLK